MNGVYATLAVKEELGRGHLLCSDCASVHGHCTICCEHDGASYGAHIFKAEVERGNAAYIDRTLSIAVVQR